LTAADVKFSLETAAAAGFDGLVKIEKITVLNENHLRILLKTPDPEFLPYLTIGIVKADITNREKNVIGTGPFFIESYEVQQNLVLKKFDSYWQRFLAKPVELPHLEKVTFVFLADTNAVLLSLRSGNIDGASLTGSFISQLDSNRFDFFNDYSAAV
jgi:peptide/nickel transport system substrate-binding protein